MHDTSALWKTIFAEPDHRKEIKVTINGQTYDESRIIYVYTEVKLLDAPSVGNAFSRTLDLKVVPLDGPNGGIPPLSEIRLYTRLVSADGARVSEYIPKGVFYSDEAKKDTDTGVVTVTGFDAIMKMNALFGVQSESGYEPVEFFTVTFNDGFRNIQKFQVQSGDAMPTPTTPTHTGEQFLAWYPDPAETPTVTGNMRFVAQWAQKYTVTFEDGSATPQIFSCFAGDPTPTPQTPEKTGFIFTEWLPTPEATVTGNATYTAQWLDVTEAVRITAYPVKSNYVVGDTLDYTGLVVTETLSSGATRDVTSECVLLPAEGTTVTEIGDIMVDVQYNGKSLGTFWVAAQYHEGVIFLKANPDIVGLTEFPMTSPDKLSSNMIRDFEIAKRNSIQYAYWQYIESSKEKSGNGQASYSKDVRLAFYPSDSDGLGWIVNVVDGSDCQEAWTYENSEGFCSLHITTYSDFDNPRRTPDWRWSNTTLEILPYAFPTKADALVALGYDVTNTIVASGDGWTLHGIGLLDIYYDGEMPYVGAAANWPWYNYHDDINTVIIKSSVTSIGSSAFYGCFALTSVTIPDSVTSIGYSAFQNCSGLTSVTIPDSVTSIREGAFSGCSGLTRIDVTNGNTAYTSENGILFNKSKTTLVRYPEGKTETAYTIPDSVTSIGESAFYGCFALTSVTIPDSVTSIRISAFIYCSGLTSVTIPDSVTSIRISTFGYCSGLTSVTIPDSVTSIGSSAFRECSALKDVYYSGTEAQRNAMSIGGNNDPLTSATWHYESTGPA